MAHAAGRLEPVLPVLSSDVVCRTCCVKLCHCRSHDPSGRKLRSGITFHRFPAWRRNEGPRVSELTRRRRAAWVKAVGRPDITFTRVPASSRVCSRHFLSGRPAYEMLDSSPDWVPSLFLGHSDLESRHTQTHSGARWSLKSCPPSGPTSGETPGIQQARPLSEVRAALQAELPRDSAGERPAGQRVEVGFRESFTAALDAALRASIRSRNQTSASSSRSCSFRIPRPREEEKSCQRCAECELLQTKIIQLEDTLSRLRGDQPPCEEEVVEEMEEVSEWAAPLSPDQESLLETSDSDSSCLSLDDVVHEEERLPV